MVYYIIFLNQKVEWQARVRGLDIVLVGCPVGTDVSEDTRRTSHCTLEAKYQALQRNIFPQSMHGGSISQYQATYEEVRGMRLSKL